MFCLDDWFGYKTFLKYKRFILEEAKIHVDERGTEARIRLYPDAFTSDSLARAERFNHCAGYSSEAVAAVLHIRVTAPPPLSRPRRVSSPLPPSGDLDLSVCQSPVTSGTG